MLYHHHTHLTGDFSQGKEEKITSQVNTVLTKLELESKESGSDISALNPHAKPSLRFLVVLSHWESYLLFVSASSSVMGQVTKTVPYSQGF